ETCASGLCVSTCGGGQICCGDGCVNSPSPPDGICCEYNGVFHACADGEQCAGPWCCGAGTEVCECGWASACSLIPGGLVCQDGRCCIPDGVANCGVMTGEACCSYGK